MKIIRRLIEKPKKQKEERQPLNKKWFRQTITSFKIYLCSFQIS